MKRIVRAIVGLRPEEIPPLLFFIPSTAFTLEAYFTVLELEGRVRPRYLHGLYRLAITAVVMAIFFWIVHEKPHWKHVKWIRDLAPFAFCISVYTNLHDTIHFVNPHDVHDQLIAIDQWMFGLQPTVWIEKYYTPFWTDYFSLAYMNYFFITIALTVWLLVERRRDDMRTALFGTVLCFYFGYILYIVFPAAPPRLVLHDQWTRPLVGSWLTVSQQKLVEISPTSSRGAFPSLHCAITFITLLYAWRLKRLLFWIILVPGISLVVATVYLRHHYVVDIYAGFALATFVYWFSPKLSAAWHRLQVRWGVAETPDPEELAAAGR